jgi:hypothetical protein
LFLEDLKELDEAGIKTHLAEEYAGDKSRFDYGEPDDGDRDKVSKYLEDYNIVIAYESVGSWGCDSSSYFLLQHKDTGSYKEFSGGHCSCYGFEGQFDPQDAAINLISIVAAMMTTKQKTRKQ